jgi:hypothetical protein
MHHNFLESFNSPLTGAITCLSYPSIYPFLVVPPLPDFSLTAHPGYPECVKPTCVPVSNSFPIHHWLANVPLIYLYNRVWLYCYSSRFRVAQHAKFLSDWVERGLTLAPSVVVPASFPAYDFSTATQLMANQMSYTMVDVNQSGVFN